MLLRSVVSLNLTPRGWRGGADACGAAGVYPPCYTGQEAERPRGSAAAMVSQDERVSTALQSQSTAPAQHTPASQLQQQRKKKKKPTNKPHLVTSLHKSEALKKQLSF